MRQLKNWLTTYMEYTAYNEAPDIFHFWCGVAAISGALRRKVHFDQTYYDWTPNFYIVLVAPAGISTKSTALGISQGILRDLESVKFGPSALTWQALAQALAGSTEMIMMPDGMFHSMSCLIFYASELGVLLDPQDRRMIDVLVDLWDGKEGVWEKATKSSGCDTIVNPWLTIAAGTTPDWLADNLPRTMIYGGFTSRCVFVYADKKRRFVPYPRKVMPVEAKELRIPLVHDLEVISSMTGEFLLSPEAEEWGEEWYSKHNAHFADIVQQDRGMSGYFARKQSHAHKLAMVLSAAQRDELVIEKEDLMTAVGVLDAVERDLPKIFKALRTGSGLENLQAIVEAVAAAKKINRADLFRRYVHIMSDHDFAEILNSAIAAGLLRLVADGAGQWVVPGESICQALGIEEPVSLMEVVPAA